MDECAFSLHLDPYKIPAVTALEDFEIARIIVKANQFYYERIPTTAIYHKRKSEATQPMIIRDSASNECRDSGPAGFLWGTDERMYICTFRSSCLFHRLVLSCDVFYIL
jgi:hypothetical protein